jgi:mono/diheme cytochrome c family protein
MRGYGEIPVFTNTSLIVPILLLAGASSAMAQDAAEAQAFFDSNCVACHTIGGGRLVGPDLHGVNTRQTREWLIDFMVDPAKVLASGDAYAQEILAASNQVPMRQLPGLDAAMAGALLDLIAEKSGTPIAAGPVEEAVPFTAADVFLGEELFVGSQAFMHGSPACISCHNVDGVGGFFGGGNLGPDLTEVFTTLNGRRPLTAWLGSPASDTMKPIFADAKMTDGEINALVAFFDAQVNGESAADRAAVAGTASASFFYSGLAFAVLILLVFAFLWRNRYTATRTPMVEASKR